MVQMPGAESNSRTFPIREKINYSNNKYRAIILICFTNSVVDAMNDRKNSKNLKHQIVQNAILEVIQSGELAGGSQLPSERELAERYSVSYMTARRAVLEMVEQKFLERRGRLGTFVRTGKVWSGHHRQPAETRLIHLICPTWDCSITRTFLRHGRYILGESGCDHTTVRLNQGEENEAIRLIEGGASAIFLPNAYGQTPPLLKALQAARNRVVLVATRQDHLGIPSVLADDSQAVRLAVLHLRSKGHRNIALVIDHPEDPIQRVQLAGWLAAMDVEPRPSVPYDDMLVNVEAQAADCQASMTYETLRNYIRSPRSRGVTAFICLGEDMSLAAIGACRDENVPVPETMSVVNVAHSTLMNLLTPPITSVDVDVERHVEVALEMLKQRMDEDNRKVRPVLRFIEPRLIERQSVRTLIGGKSNAEVP